MSKVSFLCSSMVADRSERWPKAWCRRNSPAIRHNQILLLLAWNVIERVINNLNETKVLNISRVTLRRKAEWEHCFELQSFANHKTTIVQAGLYLRVQKSCTGVKAAGAYICMYKSSMVPSFLVGTMVENSMASTVLESKTQYLKNPTTRLQNRFHQTLVLC